MPDDFRYFRRDQAESRGLFELISAAAERVSRAGEGRRIGSREDAFRDRHGTMLRAV